MMRSWPIAILSSSVIYLPMFFLSFAIFRSLKSRTSLTILYSLVMRVKPANLLTLPLVPKAKNTRSNGIAETTSTQNHEVR